MATIGTPQIATWNGVTSGTVNNPQIRYKGVYGNIKFPPYVHQEYPKYIGKNAQGKSVYVHSLRDELEWRAAHPEGAVLAGAEPDKHPVESERDELAAQLLTSQQELRIRDEQIAEMQSQLKELLNAKTAAGIVNKPAGTPKV